MKHLVASTLLLLPLWAIAAPATPAPAAKKAPAATAKAPAKAPVKKTVAKAPAKAPAKASAKKAAAAAAVGGAAAVASAGAADQPLTAEALAIAEQVHTGTIGCELGKHVNVERDGGKPGYFKVTGNGFNYHMSPVVTSTGAVRLEDTRAGAVWLQIANKSMLMDQKRGQRLADECMSPEQNLVAEAIKKNPIPSVLEPLPVAKQ